MVKIVTLNLKKKNGTFFLKKFTEKCLCIEKIDACNFQCQRDGLEEVTY